VDTLRRLDRQWIPTLQLCARALLVVGLLAACVLALLGLVSLPVAAGATLAASFLMEMAAHWSLYTLVRCPRCGGNLARFKNGRNVPTEQVYASFERGAPCRHCGHAIVSPAAQDTGDT
jgi:DNA-directed RNA polymerase subunit RPC12/RpoP